MLKRAVAATLAQVLRLPGLRRHAAALAHLQAQNQHLQDKVARLRRELDEARRRGSADARAERWGQLQAEVLRQVLPLRRAARLAGRRDTRAARPGDSFAERSASYPRALADAARLSPMPGVSHVTIGGLDWRVPSEAAESGTLAGRLLHERRLPLEDIVRTRELAVGPIMLDIGANIGTTSIPRVVLGDFTCVYAAEPDPLNYACLVSNVCDNHLQGYVMPDAVAISDTCGVATLRRAQLGTHHLLAHPGDEEATAEVPVVTLDAWVTRLGIDLAMVTYVKCDTQGWEVRVLRGAREVLARPHIAWELEFSPAMLARAGSSAAEFYDLVRRSFTHFIDLDHVAEGRIRPASDIATALAYVERRERRYTNVLAYTSGGEP